MREIKFRAWDTIGKNMLTWSEDGPYLIRSQQVDDLLRRYIVQLAQLLDNSNYIVMQYTGLKDKNGMEAYEDDILRPWEDDRIYQIVWDDDWARFDLKQVAGHRWPAEMVLLPTSEVIGNIYENPKLLPNGKDE